jgi:hypothetical protein
MTQMGQSRKHSAAQKNLAVADEDGEESELGLEYQINLHVTG